MEKGKRELKEKGKCPSIRKIVVRIHGGAEVCLKKVRR